MLAKYSTLSLATIYVDKKIYLARNFIDREGNGKDREAAYDISLDHKTTLPLDREGQKQNSCSLNISLNHKTSFASPEKLSL